MEIIPAQHYRERIVNLLQSLKLPVADLPATLKNFYVAIHNDKLVGAIGLEVFEEYGLLRSLAVEESYRGRGIAGKLVDKIEALANELSIKELYLLTETAADYFQKKGYKKIERSAVVLPIRQSSQFKEVCPVSAVIMTKLILTKH